MRWNLESPSSLIMCERSSDLCGTAGSRPGSGADLWPRGPPKAPHRCFVSVSYLSRGKVEQQEEESLSGGDCLSIVWRRMGMAEEWRRREVGNCSAWLAF
jgi:hypothetical protein